MTEMAKLSTRERIVATADNLFYRQGFEHTSFAHIAEAVSISRGNFYHHFKSKDQLLEAVIAHRLHKTARLLKEWEREGSSASERICSFINILLMNQSKITLYGCPIGTLTSELAKLDHHLLSHANQLFTLFRKWLSSQFAQLGHVTNADELSLHLLARSQGIATLANAFNDPDFIRSEVAQLKIWLEQTTQGMTDNRE